MTENDLGLLRPEWDRVSGDPAMTAFKQAARRQQATWRVNQQFEAGEQPKGQPNGSTLADEVGRGYGNFLSDGIKEAVRRRALTKQKWQTFDETRLRNNLLSSMPMCFNLFGEVDGDPGRLTAIGAALFGTTAHGDRIEFEWSPGRTDPSYTGDRTAFDVALFFGDPAIGGQTVVGVETKYHEHAVKEKAPDATTRMPRYREITERAIAERNVFKPDWESRIVGTALQQIWRDHLLLLALLQHPSGEFADGRYVLAYPAGNTSFAALADTYTTVLNDQSTFQAVTVEELIEADVLHQPDTRAAFVERYLW
ncbi:hypothetical protein SAMN05192575_1174 [Nocardioides alpinus]|uniref:PD-(D/E)XK nuclease-like domain-containing protein n=1 Tax=Nocardioides alpinus TaxID=748909 RepID=A0A1I1BDE1_9ACTN|nr:hypothetical protein [Nocardioides alpinus]PKH38462.1 hypothetical protein CXG46_15560 [Nocardioides alpinus]SFB48291.1 hypothetical protein SAMN05192575_1174 [Nocardioides alpinus]